MGNVCAVLAVVSAFFPLGWTYSWFSFLTYHMLCVSLKQINLICKHTYTSSPLSDLQKELIGLKTDAAAGGGGGRSPIFNLLLPI